MSDPHDDPRPDPSDALTDSGAAPAPAAAADPLLGATLSGRYVIRRKIGQGGMGAVYEARQLGLDRAVAVKVLRPELSAGPVELARFEREAQATARLRHPNIITVYDFDTTPDGRVFLAMELLRGPTLHEWLRENPYPDPAETAAYFGPVAGALDAMHREGIIHRDVKPSNIALPAPGDPDDVVRLLDLGIARILDADPGAELTGQFLVGTAHYLAPEVARGRKAGPPSDLYALGVTAYEALTGSTPFEGTSREVMYMHVSAKPERPTSVRSSLPAAVDEVLLRALAKDPGERYATAREFASALAGACRPGQEPAAPAPAPRKAVLLVEDDADLRAVIQLGLGAAGYEVVAASDGVDALMRLGAREFDLILSDINMPNLDGLTLLRLKSEKGVRTPVLLMTANEGVEDELRGFELGADDFLRKPLALEVLLARVRRVIERPGA